MSVRRAAVVDIGTNSVLLTIAARTTLPADPEGAPPSTPRGSEDPAAAPRSVVERVVEPVLERATITRLGEGVDATRKLSPAAVDRTLECLRDYGARIREAGVDVIALVGTSALRDAQGGEAF
ncbi:MAG: exopolyphosphatase, partial [Myxococcales bacterium]|nr:exopolyphosphatase [Myxococcales bacterium]